jgi:hypothetical protein
VKIVLIAVAIAALEIVAIADTTPEGLYTEGQAAYDRGDYPAAIARWRAAYRLSGEPGLLFDVAQALRLSGDCASALTIYRRFLARDLDPTSDQHKIAADFEHELATKCGAPIAKQQPVSPSTKFSQRPNYRSLRIAGATTGGAGVAAVATGLLFGHQAQTIGTEVTRACATSCNWATWKAKDAAGRRDTAIGYGLDAVGAAAIATGAALYYLGHRAGSVTVVPDARARGAVMSWGRAW